jgi:hypothetical protein
MVDVFCTLVPDGAGFSFANPFKGWKAISKAQTRRFVGKRSNPARRRGLIL